MGQKGLFGFLKWKPIDSWKSSSVSVYDNPQGDMKHTLNICIAPETWI